LSNAGLISAVLTVVSEIGRLIGRTLEAILSQWALLYQIGDEAESGLFLGLRASQSE
jgi:hypothetical protein